MAEKVVIFEADIELDKAIQSQKQLTDEIIKQKKELDKLRESEDDNVDAIIKKQAEIKVLNKELTAQRNLTEKIIAANKASTGSIDQLSAELAAVTKQWNALSEEERENTEEGRALTRQKTELTKKLSELRQATGDSRMEVGKYKDTTVSLKLELRENIKALAQMKAAGEDNTEAYQKLLKTTGELQDTIADTREEVKRYASDTQTLDMAIGVFRGIGSAAQVAEGASALLGDENEQLTKSIQKMVAIQSVMNGLQEIQNALQKESAAMMGLNTVKTKAMAAVQAIYTTAVGTSTGAMKVFRTALLATGIGAIIAGIALLVANWDKLSAAIGVSSEQLERNNKLYQQRTELQKDIIRNNDLEVELMKARGNTDKEINEFQVKTSRDRLFQLRAEINLLEKQNKKYADYKKIRETFGMGAAEAQKRFLPDLQKSLDEEIEKYKKLSDDKTIIEVNNLYKGIDEAKKSSEAKIKLENDVKEAYLKSEQEFFNEVEKVRAEITKRDLERIENYNDDIFAEFEDERNREAELEAKKAQRLVERLNTDFENEMAILEMNEATKFKARKMWLDAQKAEELKKAKEIGANTQLINDKYRALDLELERAKIDAKLQLSANFMGNIATLFGEGTAIGKAAAITETIINTYKGAQAAYASLSSIPVVGPALGAAAAAAQIKVGFDNIKKIKAAGKGGGGGGASSTTASAPIANAVNPSVSMGAVSGAVGTSTGQMVTNAVDSSAKTQIAVVVDDVTAKQNQQTNANKLATL